MRSLMQFERLCGVLRVVNFAYGEFIIAGSFLSYVLLTLFGLHPILSLPIVTIAFFLIGFGLYYLLIPRPPNLMSLKHRVFCLCLEFL